MGREKRGGLEGGDHWLPLGEDLGGGEPGVERRLTINPFGWIYACAFISMHLFPTKIIVFNFKRKALQARRDEGQNVAVAVRAGGREIVRSRVARTP